MHAKKLKASQLSGVIMHDRRQSKNHTNEQIDPTRSHLNYNLQVGDALQLHRQRLSQLTYTKKKSTNVLVSWLVTCPKELVGTADEKRFFETMYDFYANRYGEKNVISAYVHLDEVTPHMHFKFIPVIIEDGIEKLNAKKVIYRTELSRCHRDAEVHCKKVLGMENLILNGATAGGNKTITELKLATAKQELLEKTSELEDVKDDLEHLKVHLEDEKLLPTPKKVPFMGEFVPFKDHEQLVLEFNTLLKTSNDLSSSVNYFKAERNVSERRLEDVQSDFNTFKALNFPKELIASRKALNEVQRENRILDATVTELNETVIELGENVEAVRQDLGWYKEFYEFFVNKVRSFNDTARETLYSMLPERFKNIFLKDVGVDYHGRER